MGSDDAYPVEGEFLTIGRTFTEYRRLFDLSMADFDRGPVLDCGAGTSSFAATANAMAADVTAIDPLYEESREVVAEECRTAVEDTKAKLSGEFADEFVWDFYGDAETRCRYLRAAHQRFLADYATHPERYVAGGLPELPFETDAFATALCANLLFLYDDRLDRAFHERSLRELARVAEEVRSFPLHALDRTESDLVEPIVASLRAEGLDVERRVVPYEFQPGADEMLVIA